MNRDIRLIEKKCINRFVDFDQFQLLAIMLMSVNITRLKGL